jgi:hypothetical protein
MKRIVLALAACVLGLGLAGAANAAPYHGSFHRGYHGRVHGRVFYKHDHFRYTRRDYDVRYQRYRYWSPVSNCWYYYDAPRSCYVPCD